MSAFGHWFDQTMKTITPSIPAVPSPANTVSGHEKCATASNGAADCRAASEAICRAKGFNSGTSIDIQTEYCFAPGQANFSCAFVKRAACQ